MITANLSRICACHQVCRSLGLVGDLPASSAAPARPPAGGSGAESGNGGQVCLKLLTRTACAVAFLGWAGVSVQPLSTATTSASIPLAFMVFFGWPLVVTAVVVSIAMCANKCCCATERADARVELPVRIRAMTLFLRTVAANGEWEVGGGLKGR